MNDDWRVQIDFREEGHAKALPDRVEAVEVEHDLKRAYEDRVIVSRNGSRVFLYAGDREQAEQAQVLIEGLAQEHGWQVDCELRHWHQIAEEWESPDEPLPENEAAKRAEREELMARERQETAERGYPEFEALAELPSHQDAGQLAERLEAEGLPCVHRWKYVAVGATDEDNAKAIADRIRLEVPTGSQVTVQGTPQAAYADLPHPFAFLGGLAG
ncbi:MAG TPA: hypothetical protein VFX44_03095 [Solirubrobacterales bacterium]|nr:hypothetical protein [Solirubrobacterales bacterium]